MMMQHANGKVRELPLDASNTVETWAEQGWTPYEEPEVEAEEPAGEPEAEVAPDSEDAADAPQAPQEADGAADAG